MEGSRELPRDGWPEFLDAFTRQHENWLVSVATAQTGQEPRYLVRNVPLRGVVGETTEDAATVVVFTPEGAHFVPDAVRLTVETLQDGAEASLTVEARDGERTTIEFRAPIPPECVDGLPA